MKTQLLLALRILLRRRFFTFISLFGISFTIMALVLVAAFGDAAVGDNAPFSKRDRLVFVNHLTSVQMMPDTSYLVDSTAQADGSMRYDSTAQIGERSISDSYSRISVDLYNERLVDLPGAVTQSFTAPGLSFDTYLDGRKVNFTGNYADAAFYRVLDFQFTAGGPFTEADVKGAALKVVITEHAAEEYFGKHDASLIGQPLEIADKRFTICGIVADPRQNFNGLGAEVTMPYTTAPGEFFEDGYQGNGMAIFEVATPQQRRPVADEIGRIAASLPPMPNSSYNRFSIEGITFFEAFADQLVGQGHAFGDTQRESLVKLGIPILTLLLLLILLPALNLMNLNVGRVYERAAEIGVRKSFGATDGDILRQFLIETLLITLLGGLIGVLLALGLIAWINGEDWFGGLKLHFTGEVALTSLLVIVAFGLLTGLLPAWRMAKTRIATSLR